MRITIDTSVFLKYIEQSASGELQQFFDLANLRSARFFATTLAEAEIERFNQALKYREICSLYNIREIRVYNNQLVYDFREVTPTETEMLWKIREVLSPNRNPNVYQYGNHANDADHIFAHWRHNNEIFVSLDTGIVRRKTAFQAIGINVAYPLEVI